MAGMTDEQRQVHYNTMKKWIGVDLDGVLAMWSKWCPAIEIGPPIPSMVTRMKKWLAADEDVRIFTARAFELDGSFIPGVVEAVQAYTLQHVGKVLLVTNRKDYLCKQIWDDIAVTVERNTGRWFDWRLVTARKEVMYKRVGIDVNNVNPDGGDYHVMNAIDDRLEKSAFADAMATSGDVFYPCKECPWTPDCASWAACAAGIPRLERETWEAVCRKGA